MKGVNIVSTYLNFDLHENKAEVLEVIQTLEQIKPHLGIVNEITAINDAIEILLQLYENGDKDARDKYETSHLFIEYDY